MENFISNQHSKKELNPHIHILNYIYNPKEKSMLYMIVANYPNNQITFNKRQCIGHVEPPINRMSWTSVNSVMTQEMMDDQVQPDTFAKDETCIGKTNQ